MFDKLVSLLKATLVERAMSKTKKYVVGRTINYKRDKDGNILVDENGNKLTYPVAGSKEFDDRIRGVVATVTALASARSKYITLPDGSVESISDYKVPSSLQEIIDLGHVYMNRDAINRAEPVFEVQIENFENVLSVSQFNDFWADYNSAQVQKINVKNVVKLSEITVSELEMAMTGTEKMGELGGTITGFASYVAGVHLDYLDGYLHVAPTPVQRELRTWLYEGGRDNNGETGESN